MPITATRIRNELTRFRRAGLEFFYPPACALCESFTHGDDDVRLCPDCSAAIAPVLPDRCRRCSAPVGPFLDTTHGCVHCSKDRFAFERVFSVAPYDAALRQACLAAKNGNDGLAVALAELLWLREADSLRVASIEVVVPVPHHWTERLVRRHLPPATIGRILARRMCVRFEPHLLVKTRRTPAQTDLTPTERRTNLRNAFACPRVDFHGATVLLIDDVLTTGTTAHRCSTELKRAGASRILVAVAARGLGPPRTP